MKVLYVYRNQSLGYSIAKVFHPIEEEMKRYAEVDNVYLPEAGAKPWQLWRNIKAAKLAIVAKNYDIIHITGGEYYLIPFLSGDHKVVVTVHDLGFFTNYHLTPRTFMLYWMWIRPLRQATCVTCISLKTMKEVKKYVSFVPGQIHTIFNPLGKEFTYQPKTFALACPIVLQIGTKSNKNLENTILALKDFPHRLRIIGKLTKKQKTLLDIYHINYTVATGLTDEEILHEYEQCDIVSFPSLYEGFGMPIIEGQAVGRVVVTSNLSPMKEISGGAAVLVNPTDPTSILDGFQKAIAHQAELVHAGLENVKRFKVGKIAKEYFSLYEKIVNENYFLKHSRP